MKRFSIITIIFLLSATQSFAQSNNTDVFSKTNNSLNKANNIIAVFQPYLLKARQLFYDAKQMVDDAKQSAKTVFSKQNENNNMNQYSNAGSTTTSDSGYYSNNTNYQPTGGNYNNQEAGGYNNSSNYSNQGGYTNSTVQSYLPGQNLPVNNDATINSDGSGNWGNQNNGLYGNCLDILTGTIMGLGEAEDNSKTVDIIFVAANGSYQLWSPDYARNQVAAQYTSRSTYESVTKWNDVNETEVAETRITPGQFDKIQNNSQILNAVKNAPHYASSLTLFGKLDGKVFAVKTEMDGRTVYGLIKVYKHYGTEGSNGYLKIQIKAQGIDNNQNGQIDANAYLR